MPSTTLMTEKLTGKELYRSRREAGLRGQGDFYFKSRGYTTGKHATVGDKPISKKALRKNTKRARRAA